MAVRILIPFGTHIELAMTDHEGRIYDLGEMHVVAVQEAEGESLGMPREYQVQITFSNKKPHRAVNERPKGPTWKRHFHQREPWYDPHGYGSPFQDPAKKVDSRTPAEILHQLWQRRREGRLDESEFTIPRVKERLREFEAMHGYDSPLCQIYREILQTLEAEEAQRARKREYARPEDFKGRYRVDDFYIKFGADFNEEAFYDGVFGKGAFRRARQAQQEAKQQKARNPPADGFSGAGWRVVLGFEVTVTPLFVELKKRYRELAAKAHPDAGGSHEDMVKINRAYEQAEKEYAANGYK